MRWSGIVREFDFERDARRREWVAALVALVKGK